MQMMKVTFFCPRLNVEKREFYGYDKMFLPGCFMADKVIYGETVDEVKGVQSVQECQTKCAAHEECQFWVWNSDKWRKERTRLKCYLMSSKTKIDRSKGRVAGPKICELKYIITFIYHREYCILGAVQGGQPKSDEK